MKALFITFLLTLAYCATEAQSTINPEIKYFSWIRFNDSQNTLKGIILETNDSTILFIDKSKFVKNKVVVPYAAQVIPITSIKKIKIRKKNSVGKGIVVGTLGGALLGAVLGLASGDDTCPPGSWCIFVLTAEDKAAIGALIGATSGLLIGGLTGMSKKSYKIEGNQNLYNKSRDEIRIYTLTAQ